MKNPNIKVSVIIPVFNSSMYLRQCLGTITSQTLKEIEIIVVDDGSTDESLPIIKEFAAHDQRIKLITQQNKFAGVARNVGMELATGEYLSFVDSDDFFELNMLEELYLLAQKDRADIVICDHDSFDMRETEIRKTTPNKNQYALQHRSPFSPLDFKDELFSITNPAPWNKLFRTEMIRKYQLSFEPLKSANDITFVYTALALANRISISPNVFVHYRNNHDGNISSSRGKSINSFLVAIDRLKANLEKTNIFNTFSETFYRKSRGCLRHECRFLSAEERKRFFAESENYCSKDIFEKVVKIEKRLYRIPRFLHKFVLRLLKGLH